jgi:hypothetical protein
LDEIISNKFSWSVLWFVNEFSLKEDRVLI